jgi:hypothetical protein
LPEVQNEAPPNASVLKPLAERLATNPEPAAGVESSPFLAADTPKVPTTYNPFASKAVGKANVDAMPVPHGGKGKSPLPSPRPASVEPKKAIQTPVVRVESDTAAPSSTFVKSRRNASTVEEEEEDAVLDVLVKLDALVPRGSDGSLPDMPESPSDGNVLSVDKLVAPQTPLPETPLPKTPPPPGRHAVDAKRPVVTAWKPAMNAEAKAKKALQDARQAKMDAVAASQRSALTAATKKKAKKPPPSPSVSPTRPKRKNTPPPIDFNVTAALATSSAAEEETPEMKSFMDRSLAASVKRGELNADRALKAARWVDKEIRKLIGLVHQLGVQTVRCFWFLFALRILVLVEDGVGISRLFILVLLVEVWCWDLTPIGVKCDSVGFNPMLRRSESIHTLLPRTSLI